MGGGEGLQGNAWGLGASGFEEGGLEDVEGEERHSARERETRRRGRGTDGLGDRHAWSSVSGHGAVSAHLTGISASARASWSGSRRSA